MSPSANKSTCLLAKVCVKSRLYAAQIVEGIRRRRHFFRRRRDEQDQVPEVPEHVGHEEYHCDDHLANEPASDFEASGEVQGYSLEPEEEVQGYSVEPENQNAAAPCGVSVEHQQDRPRTEVEQEEVRGPRLSQVGQLEQAQARPRGSSHHRQRPQPRRDAQNRLILEDLDPLNRLGEVLAEYYYWHCASLSGRPTSRMTVDLSAMYWMDDFWVDYLEFQTLNLMITPNSAMRWQWRDGEWVAI